MQKRSSDNFKIMKATYIKSNNKHPELENGKSYDIVFKTEDRIYLKGLKGYDIKHFIITN